MYAKSDWKHFESTRQGRFGVEGQEGMLWGRILYERHVEALPIKKHARTSGEGSRSAESLSFNRDSRGGIHQTTVAKNGISQISTGVHVDAHVDALFKCPFKCPRGRPF